MIMQDIIKNLNDKSMIIKDLNEHDVIKDKKINSFFLNVANSNLRIGCKILKSDFYLDSFNYFPITEKNFSFRFLFHWGNASPKRYGNFYTKSFSTNFLERKIHFKNFSNAVVLGSSPSDNYYRNMMTFIPRIFFISDKKIDLVINTFNKLGSKLIIVGRGMEEKELKKSANSNIEFLDGVSQSCLNNLYSRCKALIFKSFIGTYCNTPLLLCGFSYFIKSFLCVLCVFAVG